MNSQENTNPTQDLWAILNQEYQQAIAEAQQYLQWYEKYRKGRRNASRLLRGLAIAAVAVGTLCPLIDAAWKSPKYALGQWGYVAFALAAAFVGADKFFGVSSSWMRFMLASLDLERARKEFQLNWTMLTAELQGRPLATEQFQTCLKAVQTFTLRVQDIVKQETQLWIAEFQQSAAELEKWAKTGLEKQKQ
jgi:hypothetical protein